MAIRPVFFPNLPETSATPGVTVKEIDFQWVPGQAHTQRQKCARSLREAILSQWKNARPLEISSKSDEGLGVQLSALNLCLSDGISVETHYQCAKVFSGCEGPLTEALHYSALDARKYVRECSAGRDLIAFEYKEERWPLVPESLFYDWLYCKALWDNPDKNVALMTYTCFTDIEFNPAKSVSCQAAAAARFWSLMAFNRLPYALHSQEAFSRDYTCDTRLLPKHLRTKEAKQSEFLFH